MSRKWSDPTKRLVVIAGLIAIALLIYRFRQIIPPLIIAVMLAYILGPLMKLLVVGTKLPRTWAVVVIYLALIAAVGIISAVFAPRLAQQIRNINVDLKSITVSVSRFFERPLFLFGFYINLLDIYEEVSGVLQGIISPLASRTVSFLIEVASSTLWVIFILVVSFYLLKDAQKLSPYLDRLVPSDYQEDVRYLVREINAVWNAFFRGQLVLCTMVGVVVWAAMWIVGVKNALVLGIAAGILEIVPNVGPVVAAISAILIAFFQGSARLSISNGWFALLVIGLYTLIQQLENNLLVPRIIGRRLKLHPLVVIVGIAAGASLAGPLGILVAAPILATARVLVNYIRNRLLDLEPFEETISDK